MSESERFLRLLVEQIIRDRCYDSGTLAGRERMQKHLRDYVCLIQLTHKAGHQPMCDWSDSGPLLDPSTSDAKAHETINPVESIT